MSDAGFVGREVDGSTIDKTVQWTVFRARRQRRKSCHPSQKASKCFYALKVFSFFENYRSVKKSDSLAGLSDFLFTVI